MKKIILSILIITLIMTGCKKEIKEMKEKPEVTKPEVIRNTYKDENTTPIGIYKIEGNNLIKVEDISKHLQVNEDIDTYQIYPSNEKEVLLNTNFGESFYNEFSKYKVKQGFIINYTLTNDQTDSFIILNPSNTFDKWEYLLTYLYDDYANRNKSFYSHIENEEYNENTLFTAIKLQASAKCDEIKKIELTAFTYDTDDDIENNIYKGNSKAKLIINNN